VTQVLTKSPKIIVFCDFDGTITEEETAVAMMTQFAPEISAKILPKIFDRTLPLKIGVPQIWESIPAAYYAEMIAVSRRKKIRSGFVELLDFLELMNIPLVVVSGGLRFMVETILGDLVDRVEAIYALDVDPRGEYLRLNSDFIGEIELLDKVKVIAQYNPEIAIAIGDSVTDLNMAMHADLVFAQSRLIQYLEDQQKSYIPWNNFWDVRDYLANYLQ
jgi:2-hydroxy-3-keto-5-methylthiopentenyl-1-phosphate phosphatase